MISSNLLHPKLGVVFVFEYFVFYCDLFEIQDFESEVNFSNFHKMLVTPIMYLNLWMELFASVEKFQK